VNVFDLFETVPYEFLELKAGSGGQHVINTTATTGVIKYRDGMVQEGNREAHTSQTTLHMRPDEAFINAVGGDLKLVGHGVRAEGADYRIDGVKAGRDFEDGSTAFYLCTLKKVSLWASSLPLE
jgi:hypothetical protein